MAYTYLFFQPARLPLSTDELSPDTVLMLRDIHHIKTSLAQMVPGLEWALPTWGHATVLGHGVEFHLPDNVSDGPLAMHCSLRTDYTAWVQALSDESRTVRRS